MAACERRTQSGLGRLLKTGRYDARELASVSRRGKACLALEQSPKGAGILVADRVAEIFNAAGVGVQQLLRFLDALRYRPRLAPGQCASSRR